MSGKSKSKGKGGKSRKSPIKTRSCNTCSCVELKAEMEELKSEIKILKQKKQIDISHSETQTVNFSVEDLATQTIQSVFPHHTEYPIQPVAIYSGSLFKEFSVDKLHKQIDFSHKIGHRYVKYYGELEYI